MNVLALRVPLVYAVADRVVAVAGGLAKGVDNRGEAVELVVIVVGAVPRGIGGPDLVAQRVVCVVSRAAQGVMDGHEAVRIVIVMKIMSAQE